MELEKNPPYRPSSQNRRTIQNKEGAIANRSSSAHHTDERTILEKKAPYLPSTYSREVCFLLAVVCFIVGLVGFVVDNFLSTRLGPLHSWMFLITATAALVFGYVGKRPARIFSSGSGAFYLTLGISGFVLGHAGTTTFGSLKPDLFIWSIAPSQLSFGTNDHIMHLVVGAIFVAGASLKKKVPTSGVHF